MFLDEIARLVAAIFISFTWQLNYTYYMYPLISFRYNRSFNTNDKRLSLGCSLHCSIWRKILTGSSEQMESAPVLDKFRPEYIYLIRQLSV